MSDLKKPCETITFAPPFDYLFFRKEKGHEGECDLKKSCGTITFAPPVGYLFCQKEKGHEGKCVFEMEGIEVVSAGNCPCCGPDGIHAHWKKRS